VLVLFLAGTCQLENASFLTRRACSGPRGITLQSWGFPISSAPSLSQLSSVRSEGFISRPHVGDVIVTDLLLLMPPPVASQEQAWYLERLHSISELLGIETAGLLLPLRYKS
jgi:hypothetical protein